VVVEAGSPPNVTDLHFSRPDLGRVFTLQLCRGFTLSDKSGPRRHISEGCPLEQIT